MNENEELIYSIMISNIDDKNNLINDIINEKIFTKKKKLYNINVYY